MDRLIKSQPKHLNYKYWLLLLTTILFLVILFYLAFKKPNEITIQSNKIKLSTVTYGLFSEDIAVDGIIEPIRFMTIDAPESGTIETIFHEEGDSVKKGETILKLSNSDLLLELMNRQEALAAEELRMASLRQEIETIKYQLLSQLNEVNYHLAKSKSSFSKDSFLFASNAIANISYEESFNNYHFQEEKKDLLQRRISNVSLNEKNQLDKLYESIRIKKLNLEIVSENLERLSIKANESGLLTDLNAEIGEYVMKGATVGKLDILEGFKVIASIDEHYLPKVIKGQKAEFTFNSLKYKLELRAVYPQVNNGRFVADLRFTDKIPEAITTGQSIQLRLKIGEPKTALSIERGPWNNSENNGFVYVLSNNKKTAVRKKVIPGDQNTSSVEIKDGLQKGDLVITSSYEPFKQAEIININ